MTKLDGFDNFQCHRKPKINKWLCTWCHYIYILHANWSNGSEKLGNFCPGRKSYIEMNFSWREILPMGECTSNCLLLQEFTMETKQLSSYINDTTTGDEYSRFFSICTLHVPSFNSQTCRLRTFVGLNPFFFLHRLNLSIFHFVCLTLCYVFHHLSVFMSPTFVFISLPISDSFHLYLSPSKSFILFGLTLLCFSFDILSDNLLSISVIIFLSLFSVTPFFFFYTCHNLPISFLSITVLLFLSLSFHVNLLFVLSLSFCLNPSFLVSVCFWNFVFFLVWSLDLLN